MFRIALYSHDTLGLGHLRRCLKLAEHIHAHFGRVEGVLLTGSPWHELFPLPPGFRCHALPPVVKVGRGRYLPRDSRVDLAALLRERRHRIASRLLELEPDLLVVDNVPGGLHGEMLPVLRDLRRTGARTVLALRDVLDDLGSIRREWERAGAHRAVAELFDEVWVFGDRRDTESLTTDGPLVGVASKVHSCGRIGTGRPLPASAERDDRSPVVLVTGGGGRDAAPLMTTYLDAVEEFRPAVTSHLVLGPDFPPAPSLEAAEELDDLEVRRFVPDLPERMSRSDVIVGMAGYNTVCEILASGRPAVLVPRVSPRREQWLRARRWSATGRTRLIDPDSLTPDALWGAVDQLLGAPPRTAADLPGGRVAARRAAALLGLSARGAA